MKLFWGFTRLAFQTSAMYRLEFWMMIVGNFAMMYGAYWLWRTLYAWQPGAFNISLEQMLTYAMLAMTMDTVLRATNNVRHYIAGQMRTGAIQMDLLRPLDFQFHLLARNTGEMFFAVLTLGLPGFISGALMLGMRPPANFLDGLLFLLSLAPAYLVAFSLNFLVGMITVYTIEAQRIAWVYSAVLRFFSGQMVPLWFFPLFLAQVAALLPFQCVASIPLSIYIGRLSPDEAGRALLLQVFWAAALFAISRVVWGHAHAKITVQGG